MKVRVQLFGMLRLVLVGAAVFFVLAGGTSTGPRASAVDGTAGSVAVSVVKTGDGQGVVAHAEAPDGVLIYQIAMHLCVHDAGVRTMYDFGFQGRKCTNASVGGSDVEQVVNYPNGASAADIPFFRLGTGTVRWFNTAGADQEITCAPGQPCDVVVQLQITNADVRFVAAVCFDAVCAAGTVGEAAPPATAPPDTAAPPAAAAGSSDGSTPGSTSGAAPASGAQSGAVAGKADAGTGAAQKADTKAAAGGSSSSSSGADPRSIESAAGVSVSTAVDGPSRATRVSIAAVAGLAGGVLIAGLIGRGRRQMSEVRA